MTGNSMRWGGYDEAEGRSGSDRYLSAEGDRLNLRSTLSQYLFAASSGNRQFLHGGTVQCEDPDDWAVLREFLE